MYICTYGKQPLLFMNIKNLKQNIKSMVLLTNYSMICDEFAASKRIVICYNCYKLIEMELLIPAAAE